MLQTEQILQGRYQLRQQLGQNAARHTWLAEDLAVEPKQLVIVKLLAISPQVQWEELKLFEREAQVLKNLQNPRIPKYHDYFSIEKQTDSDLPWFGLVQDYIPGSSLQQLLDEGKKISEDKVRQIADEVLNILIYLHELSPPVLHRDIKPSNLILGKNGHIYLVDFGAVQDRAKAEGVTFTVVGTSGYAPPEQLWGKAVPASDLYALGATLIHLLTGTSPAKLPQKEMRIQFNDKVSLNPSFANWLQELIEPALEQRLSTARQAFNALYTPIPITGNNQKVAQPAKNSKGIGAMITLEIIIGVIVIIALPGFLTNGRSGTNEAKMYVGVMNRGQQAYYLETNKFTNSIQQLGIGIKTETQTYNYSIRVQEKAVFNYGIPRKNELKSYIGGVFLLPATDIDPKADQKELTTLSIVCEADTPGIKQLLKPKYRNGKTFCGADSRDVSR